MSIQRSVVSVQRSAKKTIQLFVVNDFKSSELKAKKSQTFIMGDAMSIQRSAVSKKDHTIFCG